MTNRGSEENERKIVVNLRNYLRENDASMKRMTILHGAVTNAFPYCIFRE